MVCCSISVLTRETCGLGLGLETCGLGLGLETCGLGLGLAASGLGLAASGLGLAKMVLLTSLLNSNYGRKFSQSPSLLKVSHRQIPNFSRPSTRFPKQFKDFFSFMKFKDYSRLALNSSPAQEP